MTQAKYIKAYYEDEEILLNGIKELKDKGIEFLDVLTPFPVHGLDTVLGYRRSWISRAGFVGGVIGCASGFFFQAWVFTRAYPLNIGGKPFFAVPTFIPVTFEMTILCASLAMVFGFLIRSKLGPGAFPHIHNERSTDDQFVILVATGKTPSEESVQEITRKLSEAGAMGITVKDDFEISKNY
jgi:hypothetical protein